MHEKVAIGDSWGTFYEVLKVASVLLATLQLSLVITQHVEFRSQFFLGDANVYTGAIGRYLEGGNAYDSAIHPRFVYHPIFLQAFGLAGDLAKALLMFLFVLSGVYFLKALANRKETLFPFLLAFCYSGVGFDQVVVGHVTLPLHFMLLIPLVVGRWVARKQNVYIALVAVASLIKPYMLAYLAIPVVAAYMADQRWQATLRNAAIAVVGLAVVVWGDYLYNPLLTKDFLSALHSQTLVDGDLGQAPFYAFFKVTHSTAKALLLHILTVIALFGPVIYLFWKNPEENEDAKIFYLYFFLTMLNPRLKEYDISAALIAIFLSWSLMNRNKLKDWLLLGAFWVSGLRLALLYIQHESPMVAVSGFEFYMTIVILMIGYCWVLLRGCRIGGLR